MRPVVLPRPPVRPRRPRILAIQVLPTVVTLGNVLAGLLALSYLIDAWGQPVDSARREALWAKAAWAIFIGMVCDVLDGRIARLAGVASAFGAELDSLADMITFGVAPALLAKSLVQDTFSWVSPRVATALAAVYVLGAALRLARYNVESLRIAVPSHVTRVFRGLPSPGAAGVVASLMLFRHAYQIEWVAWGLLVGAPLLGLLMISRFAYAHLANRYLAGARSPLALLFLLLAVFLVIEVPEASLATLFVAYAVSGPLLFLAKVPIGRPRWAVEEDEDEDEDLLEASLDRGEEAAPEARHGDEAEAP